MTYKDTLKNMLTEEIANYSRKPSLKGKGRIMGALQLAYDCEIINKREWTGVRGALDKFLVVPSKKEHERAMTKISHALRGG